MTVIPESVDLGAIKRRQQAMWASGDFGVIASLIHLVAERLADSADLVAGSRVLDVAGGTGNAAIAAARCGCEVTCTDYVPALLERGRERARAERLDIKFVEADAEALPCEDGEYDAVLSVFGVMFAPDQPQAAAELLRVCRPGGIIGLASWTPDGFLGDLFRATAAHVPPPAGVASPLRWGTKAGVEPELLGDEFDSISMHPRTFTWRFRDAAEFITTMRHWYGPTVKAFEAVGPEGAPALERDLIAVVERSARRRDGAIAVPAEYLEVGRGASMSTLALRARRVGVCLAMMAPIALTATGPASADTVGDWNANAVTALVGTAGQSPTVSTVNLAMVHGAVYDAVNSIDERYEPYLVDVRARDWYSRDAAAATAAYRVLAAIVPGQQSTLGPLYEASLASIPAGQAKQGGITVGEIAAAAMLAGRSGDGRGGAYRFPAPTAPRVGEWRPVLPAFANDPAAWIKDVRPFLISDPLRYATDGPYPLASRHYTRDFDEVKAIGSLQSSTRTADQTDQARFWAEGPQPWTRAARQLASDRRLGNTDTARMFAMLYMTAADAAIATWSDKARWLFWRPISAIREAASDGNPDTAADATWVPLINTPGYPDQPSGLSALSAAMAESLEKVFGHRVRFTMASLTSNTTRSYRSFSHAVDEVVDARVYSGIHFRKADVDGAVLGEDVARDGLERNFDRD